MANTDYTVLTGEQAEALFKDPEDSKPERKEMSIALNIFPELLHSKQAVIFVNPHYVALAPDEKTKEKIFEWGQNAGRELFTHMMLNSGNHKIDGKDWSFGCFGSKWKDMDLNGTFTRCCFYSKKYNPKMFEDAPEGFFPDKCRFMIMMDPHNEMW
tara:strand:+ start:190 stop:657 length:468 start_codon:yes stop_codon:yes gene_type:complete